MEEAGPASRCGRLPGCIRSQVSRAEIWTGQLESGPTTEASGQDDQVQTQDSLCRGPSWSSGPPRVPAVRSGLSAVQGLPLPSAGSGPRTLLGPASRAQRRTFTRGRCQLLSAGAAGRGRGWRLHPPALALLPGSGPAETTVAGTPFKVSIASPDFGWGKPQGYSRASGVCWKDHHSEGPRSLG